MVETFAVYLKRFWNGIVLVLVLHFESFLGDLIASVGLVNKNGCFQSACYDIFSLYAYQKLFLLQISLVKSGNGMSQGDLGLV